MRTINRDIVGGFIFSRDGKGQLEAAIRALNERGVTAPVVSIALI